MKERDREEKRLRRRQEKEEAETALRNKKAHEQRELEKKVKALAPKIESMEAMWSRLCSVSRAATCDEIVAFWKGRSKRTYGEA